ncbi:MAG: hypothetical protein ACI4TK_02960, partial [Agathobacter sp.]
VVEGEVTVHLLYPDGITGEEVPIEAGEEIIIHSNEEITEIIDMDSEDGSEVNTETEQEKVECTVTFLYEGKVFATQKVVSGQKAIPPKLNPAEEGSWEFDFSQVIEEDICIEWKQ